MEELKRYGIIYKIKNTINNKVYIGQTTRKNGFNGRYPCKGIGVERVYSFHLNNKKNGKCYNIHLLRAIEKYGTENFEVNEEFDIAYTKESLNEKEIFWINKYNSVDTKFGYNNAYGGSNGKRSEESRFNFSRKHGRPIICLTTHKIFLSISDVEKEYNLSSASISHCCNKVQKFATNRKSNIEYEFEYINPKLYGHHPVVCLTTKECFLSPTEASKYYSNRTSIIYCCQGKTASAGEHPISNEKLRWEYINN